MSGSLLLLAEVFITKVIMSVCLSLCFCLILSLSLPPSGLFSELDCRPDLCITSYGVSMTTLEDVFLRLEAESEVDQAGETTPPLRPRLL